MAELTDDRIEFARPRLPEIRFGRIRLPMIRFFDIADHDRLPWRFTRETRAVLSYL